MFKGGKWKSDKRRSKSTAIFKIQFHATQVPRFGWDSLMVAVVPSGTGKPTAKTEKVQVCNGVCRWEKPIFETMKFTRDGKTGKLGMKTYKFIVYNGTAVGGFLGKATMDFAEYADASDPFCAFLPLGNSNSTVLHVTIQRLCPEDTGDIKSKGETRMIQNCKSFGNNITHWDTDGSPRTSICSPISHASKDKFSSKGAMQLSSSMEKTVLRTSESNGNLGCTFSTVLESSGAHCSSSHELSQFKSSGHKDTTSFLTSLKRKAMSLRLLAIENNDITDHTECEDSNIEYDLKWDKKVNRQNTTDAFQEIDMNEKLQAAELSIEELKNQIEIMKRQTELSDLEVQALRKHIVKENKRMQETLIEIGCLRKERDALLEQLNNLLSMQETAEVRNNIQYGSNDSVHILPENVKQLDCEKELNADLHLQPQKIQEANGEWILSVQDLEDQETTLPCNSRSSIPETCEICPRISITDNWQKNKCQIIQYSIGSKREEDQAQVELELLIKQHNCRGNASSPEVMVSNLQSEIAEHKTGHDKLKMQMEQLALDYEILKQENHKLKESQIQEQLRMQHEVSISLSVINDLETHIRNLERELVKKEEAFVAELATLTHEKVDQEQRAIQEEELLKTDPQTRQNGKNNHLFDIRGKECIAEREEMENRVEEDVLLSQRRESEREILQVKIPMPKHEAEESQVEQRIMKNVPVEKDLSNGNHNEVDHSLSDGQFAKENLDIHGAQKINDLKGEEERITSSEKKIANDNGLSIVFNNENRNVCPRSNKISSRQHSIKKSITLKDKIRLLQESHTQDCKPSTSACGRKKAGERINGGSILTRMATGIAVGMLDQVPREVRKCNSTILNSRNEDKIFRRLTSDEDPTGKLINEITKLKERNTLMEDELKEMRERYSQISLRFAEVEGERQHLVMTVRNFKNGRRI